MITVETLCERLQELDNWMRLHLADMDDERETCQLAIAALRAMHAILTIAPPTRETAFDEDALANFPSEYADGQESDLTKQR